MSVLIMLDGVDGVGKTTQIQLVKEKLEKKGYAVEASRNLGGTPIGEALRQVMLSPVPRPATADMYMSAAIQEAAIEHMNAIRKDDIVVLMDRSPLSLAAYAAYGGDINKDQAWRFVEEGMNGLRPDLLILLDGDIAGSLERARKAHADDDYFESKPLEYFERVDTGFKEGARRYGGVIVNADQPIETVNAEIMKLVQPVVDENSKD